jgi:hypothetical protein
MMENPPASKLLSEWNQCYEIRHQIDLLLTTLLNLKKKIFTSIVMGRKSLKKNGNNS